MHNIKEVNEEAFKYLIAIPPWLVINIHGYIKSHILLTTKKFVSPDIGPGLGLPCKPSVTRWSTT